MQTLKRDLEEVLLKKHQELTAKYARLSQSTQSQDVGLKLFAIFA
jgi:hypothetical protein